MYSNRNVRLILIAGFFYAVAGSVFWFSPTWLVYSLGGDNADLGRILGTATLLSIVASFISSIFADRYRRDVMIWIGALFSLTGLFGLSSSFTLDQLFLFQIITASGFSMIQPPIGSLFADSIPAYNRNRLFGTQFFLNTLSSASANMIPFILFRGTEADLSSVDPDLLRLSLRIGLGFLLVAGLAIALVRDKYSITVEEEGSVATKYRVEKSDSDVTKSFRQHFAPTALPILTIALGSTVFIGFGAGITVPYFPRFFFDIYELDLSDLSLVFAGLTVLTAVWGKVTADLADRFGRIELIVVNQALAVVLLYILATYPPLGLALLTLYIRNAVMNGTGPLNTAILMEYTPRQYRSMATAIFNIGWSGLFGVGQIAGGILVEATDFWVNFTITATLYLISTLMLWRIKHYERKKKEPDNSMS